MKPSDWLLFLMEIISVAKEEKTTLTQRVALLSHLRASLSVRIKLTPQQLSSVPAEIVLHLVF